MHTVITILHIVLAASISLISSVVDNVRNPCMCSFNAYTTLNMFYSGLYSAIITLATTWQRAVTRYKIYTCYSPLSSGC